MSLESQLKDAIQKQDTSQLEVLKAAAAEELAPYRNRMSKNYVRHIESLLAELEKFPAKKQTPAQKITGASNFFGR